MLPNPQRPPKRSGYTLIELLIVMAIIFMISIPVVKYRLKSHEIGAITGIEGIRKAELQYRSKYGKYATSLTELRAADLIPRSLGDGHLSGYVFAVTGTPLGYAVNANPEEFGSSGTRTFYSDQTGITRANGSREPATANSPAIGTAVAH